MRRIFLLQSHLKATQADTQPKLLKELAKRKSCIPRLKDLLHPDNFKTTLAITRTIKVSCLSCFLHDSEPFTRIGNKSGTRIRTATLNINFAP